MTQILSPQRPCDQPPGTWLCLLWNVRGRRGVGGGRAPHRPTFPPIVRGPLRRPHTVETALAYVEPLKLACDAGDPRLAARPLPPALPPSPSLTLASGHRPLYSNTFPLLDLLCFRPPQPAHSPPAPPLPPVPALSPHRYLEQGGLGILLKPTPCPTVCCGLPPNLRARPFLEEGAMSRPPIPPLDARRCDIPTPPTPARRGLGPGLALDCLQKLISRARTQRSP